MAFEFNGTLTVSQLERWKTYVRNQLSLVDARIAHLEAERDRIGNLAFAFDSGGSPIALTEDAPTTYCGKLYAAYAALGGDAEFDLQVRSTNQPVFRTEGDETQDSQMMSNGEVIGVKGLSDEESALLMQDSRSWVKGDLQRRRDYLERKIRRAMDYGEQLSAEISELRTIKGSAQVENSLEFILLALDQLASDKRYFAITDDSANPDPHGKLAKAPVAPYQGATPTSTQKTYDGVVRPQD